jgi:quinol monooxygenase YgiN
MLVVRFKLVCLPGKTEEVMAALRHVIAPSRGLAGVIHFDIGRDLFDENAFIATEVFEDMPALERQEAQAEVARVIGMLEHAAAKPPEATIYEVSSAKPWGE